MNLSKQTRLAVCRFLRRTEGLGAVEMALCGSVLFLCLCGIVDFSNIYFNWQMVNEYAREGAQTASLSTGQSNTNYPGISEPDLQSQIQTKYKNNNLTVKMRNLNAEQPVTVTVSMPVSIITPLISPFFQNNQVNVTGKCVLQAQPKNAS